MEITEQQNWKFSEWIIEFLLWFIIYHVVYLPYESVFYSLISAESHHQLPTPLSPNNYFWCSVCMTLCTIKMQCSLKKLCSFQLLAENKIYMIQHLYFSGYNVYCNENIFFLNWSSNNQFFSVITVEIYTCSVFVQLVPCTVPSANIGTLGKYEPRWMWK